MELESAAYTVDDLNSFLDDMQNEDRQVLAERLQRVSERLAVIGPKVKAGRGDGREWSEHEVLAHIATLSKYYGVLVHRATSGKVSEVDLLQVAQMRDAAIDQMSEREPAELVRTALSDHERTIRTLREADPRSLRRTIQVGGGATMTAEEIARLPLVAHLEQHLTQLERTLSD